MNTATYPCNSFQDFFNILDEINLDKYVNEASLDTHIDDLQFSSFSNSSLSNQSSSPSTTSSPSIKDRKIQKAKGPKALQQKASRNAPWTKKEDDILAELTKRYNYSWGKIKTRLENMVNQKKPISFLKRRYKLLKGRIKEIKIVPYTAMEDGLILQGVRQYGLDWNQISKLLPERSVGSIKTHYYYIIKRLPVENQW